MDALAVTTVTESETRQFDGGLRHLVPKPQSIEETGLSESFLADLLAKHLWEGGVLDLKQLSTRMALPGPVLEALLGHFRGEGCTEVRAAVDGSAGLRYALTDRGRALALDSLAKSGYVGPAPVPLSHFDRIVRAQSVSHCTLTRETLREAFSDMVLRQSLLDQLGPAIHSGRAIFVYGAAGTGKTYVSRRLARLLGGSVLVPHAIAIGESVVQFFDPMLHKPAERDLNDDPVRLDRGHDQRLVMCERPFVVTGGELTMDMLEVRYDRDTRQYHAPIQLKASNGMLLIDDLGRQRAATVELLNRWIVPMEDKLDYFDLEGGRHFEVPFDAILLFSTNMNPTELVDEAFLRRLGYKIRFEYLQAEEYATIWQQVCHESDVPYSAAVVEHVIENLHGKTQTPLLPCHPRDLVNLALDRCRYLGQEKSVSLDNIEWAWDNYFVRLS